MDFGELLHTAQKNGQSKREIQYYSTKFAPPKKEQKSKTPSVNVQKFLARKEAEEKKKLEDANKRRDELLQLRSKDKKATRRVNVMLKRTKSANQSVIADALDNDNTAVTLAGPSQPDEDDYGYVSQESEALYNKMMEKYSKMPDEPKFSFEKKKVSTNLSSTKDRVKATLEREREEALLPHRRKRKHAEHTPAEKEEDTATEKCEVREDKVEEKKPSKPKFKAPPPLNFSELLKIAEKKQFEPIVIEQKKEEEERPLTKRQKKEMEREKEWRERKESQGRIPEKPQIQNRISDKPQVQSRISEKPQAPPNKIPKLNGSASHGDQKAPKQVEPIDSKKIPKFSDSKSGHSSSKHVDRNFNVSKSDKIPSKADRSLPNDKRPFQSSRTNEQNGSQSHKVVNKSSSSSVHSKSIPNGKLAEKSKLENILKNRPTLSNGKTKEYPPRDSQQSVSNGKQKEFPPRDVQPKKALSDIKSKPLPSKQFPPSDLRPKQPQSNIKPKQFPPSDLKPKQFPPNDLKPKQFPPSDLKPKQFPPRDLKPKQFPPPDVRRKQFPPKDVKRKGMSVKKGRILDDDDEEYDSEMDDFIDDGPEEEEDYSKYISEIFGYDKSKYRNMDDDVDNMESTFAQQMKEEVISAKIGIMEDLEDMKKEEQEKKRKALMKKRGRL